MTVELRVAGLRFSDWTRYEIVRSLTDLSGSFSFDYDDRKRAEAALPASAEGQTTLPAMFHALRAGMPATIAVDGEQILLGHLEDGRLELLGEMVTCQIIGRDVTGDLIDCSANPQGPYVYRNIDLLAVSQKLCAPFDITVRADVELGDPFAVVAIDPSEPVMAVLEKLARQRAILITSDGIGGLVLTAAGRRRGPAPLQQPGNVHGIETEVSWRGRFSDYWIKGQTKPLLRPQPKATLDATVVPLSASPPALPPSGQRRATEAAAITKFGHAIDPAVGRYRPRVWIARTLSGSSERAQSAADPADPNAGQTDTASSAGAYPGRKRRRRRKPMPPRTDASPWTLQDQAEWRLRTCRALASQHVYVVLGHRAGDDQVLWRPNELVLVDDPFSDVQGDQLVAAVTYAGGDEGTRTRLSVTSPDAFDLTGDDANTHTGRRRSRNVGAIDGTKSRL